MNCNNARKAYGISIGELLPEEVPEFSKGVLPSSEEAKDYLRSSGHLCYLNVRHLHALYLDSAERGDEPPSLFATRMRAALLNPCVECNRSLMEALPERDLQAIGESKEKIKKMLRSRS